jgi:Resolvase, N terminal domain
MKTTSVKTRLNRKLNPSRFPHMSGLMAAIIGHILDVTFVNPAIGQIVITSDGFVLARAQRQAGANFIGSYAGLLRNWLALLAAAGLTRAERMEAELIAAFAELERAIIAERVRSGLQNAVRRGKKLGRGPIAVDKARIARLRANGASLRAISVQLGISFGSVHRALQCSKNL